MTVEKIIAAMQDGWNNGDGAAWAASFSPNSQFVDALGRIQHGRDVIAAEHQKLFDTIYRGSRIHVELLSSQALCQDVTLTHIESTLTVDAGPRAGTWPAIITLIIQDGQIVAFHNTMRSSIADISKHDEALGDRKPLDWDGRT